MKKILLVLSLLVFIAVPVRADDFLTEKTLTLREEFALANTQEALQMMAAYEKEREKKAWVTAKDENKLICQRTFPEHVLDKENYGMAVDCFLAIIDKTIRAPSPAPELIDDLATKWRASVKKYETNEITKEQIKDELDKALQDYLVAHNTEVDKAMNEFLPKLPKSPPPEPAPAEEQAQ